MAKYLGNLDGQLKNPATGSRCRSRSAAAARISVDRAIESLSSRSTRARCRA